MGGASGEAIASDGIVKGHAYSLITARELQADGRVWRVLQLRNPWGANPAAEWKGVLSDSWPQWGQFPQLREALEMDSAGLDGMFWMEWDDFRNRYSDFGIVPKQMEVPKLGTVEGLVAQNPSSKHAKKFSSSKLAKMQPQSYPQQAQPQQIPAQPMQPIAMEPSMNYIQPSRVIHQQVPQQAAPQQRYVYSYQGAQAAYQSAQPAYQAAPAAYATSSVSYAAAPVTYAAAPATYAAAPVTYSSAPVTYAAPALASADSMVAPPPTFAANPAEETAAEPAAAEPVKEETPVEKKPSKKSAKDDKKKKDKKKKSGCC